MESTAAQITLLSSAEVWDRVDPLSPDLPADPATIGLGALPYKELKGPGFERLCYELLVAEGHSPRFFGRNGQKDYGVDILVEAGTKRTVYQCKNLTEAPSWTEIREAITTFEADWLGKAGLPRVNGFVYCCPHPLDDRSFAEDWTRFKDDFQSRIGVEVSFLDRHGLDTRLRQLPDIVAGLFSGSYAEHFCGRDGWLDDPWSRLRRGEARHASIARFLDRHQRGAIHVPEELAERFQDLLSNSPVVALRGLPGSGKTLTGLEMIASQSRNPARRIYYATLGSFTDFERLWQSVRRRNSLPSVFVLDDCHVNLEKVGLILERLAPELSDAKKRIRLLLILRDGVGSSVQLDDTPDWLQQLNQDARTIDLETGLERTRAVTLHLRPDLAGLSRKRLERLHYTSGGDLLLLDEALANVSSPQDLDGMSPDFLHGSLRFHYFKSNRRLPIVKKLACLAQFELVPLASFLDADWLPTERELAAPLMTELFAPRRYEFLHSSLAELILRSLVALESDVDRLDERVIEFTVNTLIAYLKHALSFNGGDGRPWFLSAMQVVLRGRLKLAQAPVEARIKASVLADETIHSAIEADLNNCTFTILHICVLVLSITDHPAKERYTELIERRFGMLFQGRPDALGLTTVGTGFFTLARNAPSSLETMERKHGANNLFQLIVAHGTLPILFRILQYASPSFRLALLELLNGTYARVLVEKTISSNHSIGTLNLTMRELGDWDPISLGRLEAVIGSECFLRLIAANGTLFEFFRIVQFATPGFRLELLERLDKAYAEALVDKTIVAGRSIGTLHLAMREVRNADQVLLEHLETAIGAECFLRLIAANGTLFELFRVVQYATPSFRLALLERLDDPYVGALVGKTMASGRSIGTLHLAMREVRNTDQVLLEHLETAIGAERFLRLIVANGTLSELFKVLAYATPNFRRMLLRRLDEASIGTLINKTIAASRSIESFHFMLGRLNRDPEQRGRLEDLVSIKGWWRLVLGLGNLNSLTLMSHAMSEGFRGAFVHASSTLTVVQWCAIIARGLFLNACRFVTDELASYSSESQAAFRKALGQTAASLAAKATWFDLNPSRIPSSDFPEARILHEALGSRIEGIQVRDLLGLEFREAVNGLAFAWRERPDLRVQLGERLWGILPDPLEWPREEGEVAVLRFIFGIARSENVCSSAAHRLLEAVTSFLDREVCAEMHTLPLFLLLWNMAALRYERGANRAFAGVLPDSLIETVSYVLRERIQAKDLGQEKLAQLALGGLLGFLVPKLGTKLRQIMAPLASKTEGLRRLALEQTFVPALFALEGLALLSPGAGVFTATVCFGLTAKSNEYEEIGPALEHLRDRVKRYGKRR